MFSYGTIIAEIPRITVRIITSMLCLLYRLIKYSTILTPTIIPIDDHILNHIANERLKVP